MNVEPKKLYIEDVFKIFYNYEPSKLRLFEIIRNIHPHHTAALIYLIENIKKSNKILPYIPNDLNMSFKNEDYIINLCEKTTFSLSRCIVLSNYFPDKEYNNLYDKTLTILEFLQLFKNNKNFINSNNNCKILLNNLCTQLYNKFIDNIKVQFPDYMQPDRNEWTKDEQPLVIKFLDYYKTLKNECITVTNLNPKTFRFVFRSKNKQIFEKPNNLSDYDVQPLYQGFRVVVYTNKHYTRIYNCHGELIKSCLYNEPFNIDATFEAILLPIDKTGQIKSWRYWPYKTGYKFVVVDIFRIKNQMFTHLPQYERTKHIPLITGDNIHKCDLNTMDKIERMYYNKLSLFNPIAGFIFKKTQSLCNETSYALYFNLNFYYHFMKNTYNTIEGDFSVLPNNINYNMHIKYEMSDYRTVCIIYSDDHDYYYVCKFNLDIFQFVHVGKIKKLPTDNKKPNYQTINLFVVDCKNLVKGVLYLRVYFNNMNSVKSLIGYEHKFTTSMHDIPSYNTFDLFS